jgi:pilus assembly protein CpaD
MNKLRGRFSALAHTAIDRRFGTIGLVVVFGTLAGACSRQADITGSVPMDYRQRHPIVLTQGNETLDIFVGSGKGLDHRQLEDIKGFARDYMQTGQGPLIAYLPSGGHSGAVNHGLSGIRQALSGGGASGRLQIAHYHAEGGLAAPIKLAFAKLKADVPNRCGYDSQGISASGFRSNVANDSPHNFGCTYQRNLAAQIADPRDLVTPRREGPIDLDRRLAGIERLREGDTNDQKLDGKTLKQINTQ